MKIKITFGAIYAIMGILIILTPRLFFPVCGLQNDPFFMGSFASTHGCHATLNAVNILGLLAVIGGLILLLRPNKITFLVAIVISLLVSVLTILCPLKITGICKMATMSCRLGTLPGLITAGIMMGVAGISGFIAYRNDNEEN